MGIWVGPDFGYHGIVAVNIPVCLLEHIKSCTFQGAWLAQSVESATLDLEVVSSSHRLGIEFTYKLLLFKKIIPRCPTSFFFQKIFSELDEQSKCGFLF